MKILRAAPKSILERMASYWQLKGGWVVFYHPVNIGIFSTDVKLSHFISLKLCSNYRHFAILQIIYMTSGFAPNGILVTKHFRHDKMAKTVCVVTSQHSMWRRWGVGESVSVNYVSVTSFVLKSNCDRPLTLNIPNYLFFKPKSSSYVFIIRNVTIVNLWVLYWSY